VPILPDGKTIVMPRRDCKLDSEALAVVEKILKRGDDARITTDKTGLAIYSERKKKEYTQARVGGCKGQVGPESTD
jgi:hypothetical protein